VLSTLQLDAACAVAPALQAGTVTARAMATARVTSASPRRRIAVTLAHAVDAVDAVERPASASRRRRRARLRQRFDDLEQLRPVIAALAAELDELDRLGEHGAALGRAADADAAALAKLEQSLVAQEP
jgi:hypothetical protein